MHLKYWEQGTLWVPYPCVVVYIVCVAYCIINGFSTSRFTYSEHDSYSVRVEVCVLHERTASLATARTACLSFHIHICEHDLHVSYMYENDARVGSTLSERAEPPPPGRKLHALYRR